MRTCILDYPRHDNQQSVRLLLPKPFIVKITSYIFLEDR